jgi:hypothetical protein
MERTEGSWELGMKEEVGMWFRVDKTPAKRSRVSDDEESKVPYGVHYFSM